MLAVAVSLVLDPLADVAVTSDALPHTVAVFDAVHPFAIIGVTIDPSVQPFARDVTILVVAQVLVTVAESFIAFAVAFIALPLAFVDSPDLVDTYTLAFASAIFQFAAVERLLIPLDVET